jgi:hypothetical protein
VLDPEHPDGLPALAIYVPAKRGTRIWEFVEPDYDESIELVSGSAKLLILKKGEEDWTTIELSKENPKAEGMRIGFGDLWCLIANEEEDAVVLSRSSKSFDPDFERVIADHPADLLAQYVKFRSSDKIVRG